MWALNLAERYKIDPCNRTWLYNQKLKIADALVYKKIRQTLGAENFDIVVSGAASIQPNIAAFFSAIKMPIFEGYGMTEAAPMITFTRPGRRKIGYTGDPLPNIEVKIADNGEICLKGDNVMQGYYKREEETAQIIKDGWLHTGDLGYVNKYGCVHLYGRKDNLIVSYGGENVYPEEIEAVLDARTYFTESLVIEDKGGLTALVYPDFDQGAKDGMDQATFVKFIESMLPEVNKELPNYAKLKKIEVMSEAFERTPKKSIKRFLYK